MNSRTLADAIFGFIKNKIRIKRAENKKRRN